MAKMIKKSFEMKIGIFLVGAVVFLALISVFYTPYDISLMNPAERNLPPSLSHIAGTDRFGRDIFSRLMVGSRFTLLTALATVTLSAFFGTALGLFSGYAGGIVDEIIMRLVDAITSFPGILIALIVVTVLDYGKYTIILALCIMFVPSFTRVVRMGTLQFKDSEFVRYCRTFGASHFRIVFVHILPNVCPMLLSSLIIGLSNAILAESSMSYLGLGIQPPSPSWGWMLNEAQSTVFRSPWYALSTGLMIVLTIAGFNFIGEGLRRSLSR